MKNPTVSGIFRCRTDPVYRFAPDMSSSFSRSVFPFHVSVHIGSTSPRKSIHTVFVLPAMHAFGDTKKALRHTAAEVPSVFLFSFSGHAQGWLPYSGLPDEPEYCTGSSAQVWPGSISTRTVCFPPDRHPDGSRISYVVLTGKSAGRCTRRMFPAMSSLLHSAPMVKCPSEATMIG